MLPGEDAARKYVDYMGGEAAVMERASADFDKGEYRWVGMVLRHVVFADPENAEAKELLARAYEQMGYQAESGPWRSVYLQGAYELRNGTPPIKGASASPDVVRAMSIDMLFDFLAVRLDSEKAEGKVISVNFDFTDLDQHYTMTLENSVLNHTLKQAETADASVELTKAALDDVNLGVTTLADQVEAGNIKVSGNVEALKELFDMIDSFSPAFNVVTP